MNGEKEMNKILLIDGHSILSRAFYGLPDLTNAEGLHTNAVLGFINMMLKAIEEEKPEYLTVAFDVHAPTFRHEMFAEYKGTRKPMPEELREQVPLVKEVLRAMGVCIVEKAGYEADDILGTIGKLCEKDDMQVVILSGDRDMLQLASRHIKIRIPKTKGGRTEIENYYEKEVLEKYQVTPTEFIDLKALMGDSSDNIPGVPSIGEKTATAIITVYKSIENAYAHVNEIKPPRASKALKEHYELAQLSKVLATICVTAEIIFEKEEAQLKNLYTEEAYDYFLRLQFKNLLNRFQIKPSDSDTQIEEQFKKIEKKAEAEEIFSKAAKAKAVSVSFLYNKEVLPLFADMANFKGLGICFDEETVYLIMTNEDIDEAYLKEKTLQIQKNVETFSVFDIRTLLKELPEIERTNCFDISIAAYLLNPLKNDYTSEDVANEHLSLMLDFREEEEKKAYYEAYTAYCGIAVLTEKLKQTNMWELFLEIEMPLSFVLHDMEVCGVKVESKELKIYGDALAKQIAVLEKEIYEMAGETFNINSPKQMAVVLFEHMGLPSAKKTKTGYSTSAEVLEKLAAEYPVVSKILEYRQLAKLKSTYADGLANYIAEDGRIHGKFNQTITATGRISSTEPNLQNIPIRMELGRQIRKVFVPEEGYVFVDADYSQIELRVLAHCAEDVQLIQAYREAKDIHRITASQVFHIPFEEVTSDERRNAKAVNFGIVYGISSFGLSQDLSISRKEAATYIEEYFKTYPGIKQFLDDTVTNAKEDGYVTTLFQRRRPIPELSSSNFMQRSFGERVAMNSPIQGTAADIMKIAMIHVAKELQDRNLKSRLVLQVHDELLIEAHQSEVEIVKEILKTCMENAAQLKVPLEIDMNMGENWYETK